MCLSWFLSLSPVFPPVTIAISFSLLRLSSEKETRQNSRNNREAEMNRRCTSILFIAISTPQMAGAHHLDEYDTRIHAEIKLPAEWFICRREADCALVSVPCQSGLAANAGHVDEAREVLTNRYPFCLGTSLSDTKAACEERQCVTKLTKGE
jgi:hypothetical protein